MSNDSVRGFVFLAMRNLGYNRKQVEDVFNELHILFDRVTDEQAEQAYYNYSTLFREKEKEEENK